jgi:hypothetical protein
MVCSDMDDLPNNTLAGDNESKRISCLVDTKYYYELITKKHLQANEEYEHSIQQQRKFKDDCNIKEGIATLERKLILKDQNVAVITGSSTGIRFETCALRHMETNMRDDIKFICVSWKNGDLNHNNITPFILLGLFV